MIAIAARRKRVMAKGRESVDAEEKQKSVRQRDH